MRRFAVGTATTIMLLSLVACGDKGEDDVDVNPGKGNDVCQGEECGDEDKDD